MTSGNSAAFAGQLQALATPQAASSMTAMESASDALLGMAPPRAPRLDDRVADHHDRDREQHHHDRPREPRRLVARDRDVQVVLGDLAEHEPEDERRARPAR